MISGHYIRACSHRRLTVTLVIRRRDIDEVVHQSTPSVRLAVYLHRCRAGNGQGYGAK